MLHYQVSAYNLAYRLVGEQEAAADATQEAFISAYNHLSHFRGGSFKAWLLRRYILRGEGTMPVRKWRELKISPAEAAANHRAAPSAAFRQP